MMNINLSVLPTDDDEAALALSAVTTLMQSLAFKGVGVSVSINTYNDSVEEEPEETQG